MLEEFLKHHGKSRNGASHAPPRPHGGPSAAPRRPRGGPSAAPLPPLGDSLLAFWRCPEENDSEHLPSHCVPAMNVLPGHNRCIGVSQSLGARHASQTSFFKHFGTLHDHMDHLRTHFRTIRTQIDLGWHL